MAGSLLLTIIVIIVRLTNDDTEFKLSAAEVAEIEEKLHRRDLQEKKV